MESEETLSLKISRESLFAPEVEEALTKQKALERLAEVPESVPVSLFRQVVYSTLFYMPLFAWLGAIIAWLIIEPSFSDEWSNDEVDWAGIVFFPLVTSMIVMALFVGEGIMRRMFLSNFKNGTVRGIMTFFLAFVPLIVAGLFLNYIIFPLMFGVTLEAFMSGESSVTYYDANPENWPPERFLAWLMGRTISWVLLGSVIGLGLQLGRGTTLQMQSNLLGGMVGGAFGGILFDTVDRFVLGWTDDAAILRAIGVSVIGVSVGIFVALSEQLSREGWFRVRTGPLAGKAFVVHRELTSIGSVPQADIYLFKDPDIDPRHAVIHKYGSTFVIEDMGSRDGTHVNHLVVTQRRLQSGDQVMLGATILEFEERAKREFQQLEEE